VSRKFSTTTNEGGFANIYVPASGAADYASGGFIANVLWVGTGGSTDLSYWVEGGYTKGWHGDAIRTFYWARNTKANGYAEHKVGNATPTVGTYEPVEIQYTGSNIWSVYFNFVKATSPDGSTANISALPNSASLETGLESTSSGSYSANAWSNDLEYKTTGGSWSSQWPSGGTLVCDSPAAASWVTTNVKLQYSEN